MGWVKDLSSQLNLLVDGYRKELTEGGLDFSHLIPYPDFENVLNLYYVGERATFSSCYGDVVNSTITAEHAQSVLVNIYYSDIDGDYFTFLISSSDVSILLLHVENDFKKLAHHFIKGYGG